MQQLFTTRIKQKLLTNSLIRGTIFAGIGIFLWVFCYNFSPHEYVKLFGFSIYLIGALLITHGFYQFKVLSRLQIAPNYLIVDDDVITYIPHQLMELAADLCNTPLVFNQQSNYQTKTKKIQISQFATYPVIIRILRNNIKLVDCVQSDKMYGIGIYLKNPHALEYICAHSKKQKQIKYKDYDVYFPFFDQKAASALTKM